MSGLDFSGSVISPLSAYGAKTLHGYGKDELLLPLWLFQTCFRTEDVIPYESRWKVVEDGVSKMLNMKQ